MTARRFTFWHYIERGDDELELFVTYSGTRHVPATYWQPAEGGEVELISVTHNDAEVALTDAEESTLIDVCQQRVGSDFAEYDADAAEYRAESRRDALMMERWGGAA